MVFNFSDLELWELADTCALDVAERAPKQDQLTLREVGDLMNLTRQRVRQIEEDALAKLRAFETELE